MRARVHRCTMPTVHVRGHDHGQLQHIADAILKARKVVVVTGAGISTNSGIPDFRSENGLYAMIQAQLDAAAAAATATATTTTTTTTTVTQQDDNDSQTETKPDPDSEQPPSKRRKTLETQPAVVADYTAACDYIKRDDPSPLFNDDDFSLRPSATPQPCRRLQLAGDCITALATPTFHGRKSHLSHLALDCPSSPLSSPPPILLSPRFAGEEEDASTCDIGSSTSASDVDDDDDDDGNPRAPTVPSKTLASSMKGKDLFDASIWADPLRTSVFYTFATTLRQRAREAAPTSSHRFISHLRDRGKLVRCYTQNIDQMEERVGLSTSLTFGPGSRRRFTRKSVGDAVAGQTPPGLSRDSTGLTETLSMDEGDSICVGSDSFGDESLPLKDDADPRDATTAAAAKPKRQQDQSNGVECVFLHGSLQDLRCFLCGKMSEWDDVEREKATLSGQQPDCPHCVGATAARTERGKRALGIGKLRPDIVLYGEENPAADLISPLVTNDLSLSPDVLLILGTSLRVHGLKVMVREFAKAVHARTGARGAVIFVNLTKPPESTWGDVIDFWVECDCDAWVADLQRRVPRLWLSPQQLADAKRGKKEAALEAKRAKQAARLARPRNPSKRPQAVRDDKANGAYMTWKVMKELRRISGGAATDAITVAPAVAPSHGASADPATVQDVVVVNNSSSSSSSSSSSTAETATAPPPPPRTKLPHAPPRRAYDLLASVKVHPRVRKRKTIDGIEVVLPRCGPRRGFVAVAEPAAASPPEE